MERRVSRLAALLLGQVVPGQAAAALPGEEDHVTRCKKFLFLYFRFLGFTTILRKQNKEISMIVKRK